jgi:CRISPR system Cascade subunit CasE
MFISRIEISRERACNPYELHRALWSLFPGEPRESRESFPDERAGFLFRIEDNPTGRPAQLLVQSRRAPVARARDAIRIGVREFDPRPYVGQRLAFLLTANPVKAITDEANRVDRHGEVKKCRVPLIREEQQRAWLVRKLDNAAQVVAATVQPHPPLYFRKGARAGKLGTVTFEGTLKVTDPASLRKLLEDGVGPAKAFGCGLLLVRRAG